MFNEDQFALLKAGVETWNKWREENSRIAIDLRGAHLDGIDLQFVNLSRVDLKLASFRRANLQYAYFIGSDLREGRLQEADLRYAFLYGASLRDTDLRYADLRKASLREACFAQADLRGADLRQADLSKADLSGANLSGANFTGANLAGADLRESNLSGANLTESHLMSSNLVGATIENAIISGSRVYGVSVWDLIGTFREQKDLIITPKEDSRITVDDIKVAQFVYLILNNIEIRDVINTLTSKTVLILGRFTIPERKAILDALRDKLREYNLLPIVFDFDRPTDKDFTETIKTLAGMCYFVIADVTNPRSSPLELQATVPDYQIPFVPIIQEGEYPFAMMANLQTKYNWVLDTISYDSLDTLIEILKPHIIDPAIRKRDELRLIKAKEPTIISGRELRDKKD